MSDGMCSNSIKDEMTSRLEEGRDLNSQQYYQTVPSMSGIEIDAECLRIYEEQKMRHQYVWTVYRINPEMTLVVPVAQGGPDATFEDFCKELPEEDCRFAVYDAEYTDNDGNSRKRLCFVMWNPDNARVRSKMIYSATQRGFLQNLTGVDTIFQATDAGDLVYADLAAKCKK
ncbi:ADF/Cofilin/Destrin [Kipferlia bialata]|uniref:ADF/Cofilin/Destrin n=1 Tax=Kipferlia bialata TaxID=797122 RepID=A0A9K3CQW6_9EUKA|nr:ADF/Cofilin/Destrin [Kipferlia bialata]|eukprot:g1619.t1